MKYINVNLHEIKFHKINQITYQYYDITSIETTTSSGNRWEDI